MSGDRFARKDAALRRAEARNCGPDPAADSTPTASAAREPRTAAGRALIEWASNAMPANQQQIWRDHVRAIEDQMYAKATEGSDVDWHYCDFDSPHHLKAEAAQPAAPSVAPDAVAGIRCPNCGEHYRLRVHGEPPSLAGLDGEGVNKIDPEEPQP